MSKNRVDIITEIEVATMKSSHLANIINLHLLAFPDFFLTCLGGKFLKIYYRAIIQHDNAIKIVILSKSEVVGFVVGAIDPAGFYSKLIKYDKLAFICASIPAITRNPLILPRIVHACSKPKRANQDLNASELTSFAISPEFQKQGYGKLLIREYVRRCRDNNVQLIYLTTDAEGNQKVNDFYVKAGFVLVRSFVTPDKRFMNEYQYIL